MPNEVCDFCAALNTSGTPETAQCNGCASDEKIKDEDGDEVDQQNGDSTAGCPPLFFPSSFTALPLATKYFGCASDLQVAS